MVGRFLIFFVFILIAYVGNAKVWYKHKRKNGKSTLKIKTSCLLN